jgi:hypothetical protein
MEQVRLFRALRLPAITLMLNLALFAPTLRAQISSQITIKDPSEFNTYQNAATQNDPKAKAAALETFLQTYPQSVVKRAVLVMLMDTYQGLGDADHVVSTAGRVLQVDPNNMEPLFLSVVIKRSQCTRSIDPKSGKTNDAQTCDDGATMAAKGLTVAKPDGVSNDDWKKQTDAAYPIFHSMNALDDIVSKGDTKAGIAEYRNELMIFAPEATQAGPGLVDTLNLAEAYVRPEARDLVNAVWFYSRAWDFAPASYKTVIEKKLEYWYNKYHGAMDGLDAIKQSAQATVFPPGTLLITPADTPAQKIHKILMNTPDLRTLTPGDQELVLAYGFKEDVEKLRAALQDQVTSVPNTSDQAPVTPPADRDRNLTPNTTDQVNTAQKKYEDFAAPQPPPAPAPTISMGNSKDQVIVAFGEPQRKAAVGPKEIFFYTDMKMKVTFTNGKVSGIE